MFLSSVRFLKDARPRFSFFALLALTLFSSSCIKTQVSPKIYTATAIIMIGGDCADPALAPAACEVIRSPDTLLPVIKKLGLATTWAQRLHRSDESLSDQEALAYLSRNLKLSIRPRTTIIHIHASSELPEEEASIANAIAHQYLALHRGNVVILKLATPPSNPDN